MKIDVSRFVVVQCMLKRCPSRSSHSCTRVRIRGGGGQGRQGPNNGFRGLREESQFLSVLYENKLPATKSCRDISPLEWPPTCSARFPEWLCASTIRVLSRVARRFFPRAKVVLGALQGVVLHLSLDCVRYARSDCAARFGCYVSA